MQAVDLCFRSRLFDALRDITRNLGSDTDPHLLKQCAEFFLDHGQYERTVQLFVIGGDYLKVLDSYAMTIRKSMHLDAVRAASHCSLIAYSCCPGMISQLKMSCRL